ncbi:ribosomal protein S18-alanine N-acetyltransferase [Brevibacillus dissolubilis]|uniref:ribosomal protein S18-alanine N-acetyltransferase n=1 Tax=Brevibacillus dissolubilis TaxID=1844116 RepID=UPI0011177510|nr:ribosomal protein S18-alanine N-acetyltransferase [Brevibacillus dissolubilis]
MVEQSQLDFRFMTVEDVGPVVELEHLSFTTPWPMEAFITELTVNQNAKYVVATANGRVIGYCGMWVIIDEAHITNVAIHPDYRGLKIGEKLMRQMMGLAVIFGAERMTLEVRPSNEVARNMYKKLGFEDAGRRKGYYSDNNEDALIMWVNLT